MPRPLIIAHRGAPGRLQNTLAGFRRGLARGADGLELDVHQTADGALVVFHDFEVAGRPLARLTLRQARALVRRERGVEMPTLDEVLEAVPRHAGLGVEIKAPGIGPAVLRVLRQHRAVARALCSSFDLPTVAELAGLRPRVRTGLLTASRLRDPVGELRRARAQVLLPKWLLVDRALVRQVQRVGAAVIVWTVNREDALRRMLRLGVDAIITDYPERLARLLRLI